MKLFWGLASTDVFPPIGSKLRHVDTLLSTGRISLFNVRPYRFVTSSWQPQRIKQECVEEERKGGTSTTVPRRGFTSDDGGGGGLGLRNVHDRVLTTCRVGDKPLFGLIKAPRTVSVIGAPMTFGQPFVGTDDGPALLREAGLLSKLTSLGWRVEDNPDLELSAEHLLQRGEGNDLSLPIEEHPDAKNSVLVGRMAQLVSDIVHEKASRGLFPLLIGGDHSVSLGSLHGILRARPNTGVLWIDAHADLNTPATSESGNMHGMPVGMIMEGMGVDYSSIPGCEWLMAGGSIESRLRPDAIVYVALRDVDSEERKVIREKGILAFTMTDIDHYGIGRVMDMALSHLLENDSSRPIHLSFDIDAVDPVLAPATGTAVRGGLTYREAHYVAEAAAASGSLASADMVELNPSLSDGEGAKETVGLGLRMLTSLMGKSII